MLNLSPPPPGFQGFRDDLPLTMYQRHLPHWRQKGATYFVTFRTNDSIPAEKLRLLDRWKANWEREHPPPRSRELLEEFARMAFTRIERWLDAGYGRCVLNEMRIAEEIAKAMHHFDEARYELGCYVVMPNHVHAVVRPTHDEQHPLEMVLKSWKSHTAKVINELLSLTGQVWQEESYDRIIRDGEHLWRVVQYIGANPERAGLVRESRPIWIRPAWEQLGWTFEWRRTHS